MEHRAGDGRGARWAGVAALLACPGASVDDFVAVTNFSEEAAAFAVYASDGVVAESGDFDLLAPGEAPSDGGSWIQVGAVDGSEALASGGQRITVPAGGTTTLPLRIDVPANAVPGDHPAGVVAELVPDGKSAVQLSTRIGARVHLRVSGEISPALTVDGVDSSFVPSWNPFAPGTLSVDYTVTNSGNVRVGADTVVTTSGPFGLLASSVSDSRREVLPGQSATQHAELAVWPLVFAWGDLSVTPTVVGDDEVAGEITAATQAFSGWTPPWSQLAVLLLVLALVFLVRTLRRRAAAQVQRRIEAAVAAATGAGATVPAGSEPVVGEAAGSSR